jgi:hypothetical protein
MNKIDDLRWVRVFSPQVIPKYLVDNIKHKDFTTDEFFEYQEIICLRQTDEGPTLNPFSHLYALADSGNIVKGILWFTIDPLSKNLFIQTYSVDKEYWDGGSIKKLSDHIKIIRDSAGLRNVFWITDYPKHSKRHGFKMSKSVLMEYSEEEESKNGKDNVGGGLLRGECGPSDEGPEEVHGGDSGQ